MELQISSTSSGLHTACLTLSLFYHPASLPSYSLLTQCENSLHFRRVETRDIPRVLLLLHFFFNLFVSNCYKTENTCTFKMCTNIIMFLQQVELYGFPTLLWRIPTLLVRSTVRYPLVHAQSTNRFLILMRNSRYTAIWLSKNQIATIINLRNQDVRLLAQ